MESDSRYELKYCDDIENIEGTSGIIEVTYLKFPAVSSPLLKSKNK